MNTGFLVDNFSFTQWSYEHIYSLIFWLLFAVGFITISKKYFSKKQQRYLAISFALFVFFCQIAKICIKYSLGTFDIRLDLPLHLCNMMPIFVAFAFYLNNRTFWSVLFYWIMAGTFQSLITPTLEHSFPHFEYHRYFIIHAGLVILALYPYYVYQWRLRFYDAFRSMIFLNVVGCIMYFIDKLLAANYMYMIGPPNGATIYDLLGPWPWYTVSIQGLMLLLFSILTILFYDRKKITFQQSDL